MKWKKQIANKVMNNGITTITNNKIIKRGIIGTY